MLIFFSYNQLATLVMHTAICSHARSKHLDNLAGCEGYNSTLAKSVNKVQVTTSGITDNVDNL